MFETGNIFTKKDPLAESVKKVMETNELHREVVSYINESLGIEDRKALPFEIQSDYDTLVKNVFEEAKVDESVQKQIKYCSKTAKQTLKHQKHHDIHQNPFNSPGTEEVFNKVKKYLQSIGFLAAPIAEEEVEENYRLSDKQKPDRLAWRSAEKKLSPELKKLHGYDLKKDIKKTLGTHTKPKHLPEEEQLDEKEVEGKDTYNWRYGGFNKPKGGEKRLSVADRQKKLKKTVKEDEQLDETSTGKKIDYLKKAYKDRGRLFSGEDRKEKRKEGILRAYRLQHRKLEEDEQIDEAGFGAAFAAARAKMGAGKTFTYNGKSYSTNRADDAKMTAVAKDTPTPPSRPATTSTWKAPAPVNQVDTIAKSGGDAPRPQPTNVPTPPSRPADLPAPASTPTPPARPAGLGQPGNDASNFVKKQLGINEEVKPVTYKII